MKQLFAGLLLLSCNLSYAGISISIITPEANQPSDSTLSVQASVQSTYEITSVTASVIDHQQALSFESIDNWFVGSLSLAGLPKGVPLQLIVTAKDYLNNQQSDTVTIIYAPPPTVVIDLPLDWTNAYPSLPLKATCYGAGPCILNISYLSLSQNFTNSIDTVVTIQNNYTTEPTPITFTATDQWGQSSYATRQIFFNNNPYLKEIYSGVGKIFDFNYNKVLIVNDDTGKIADLTTHGSSIFTGTHYYYQNGTGGELTPYGVIYGPSIYTKGFELNNDSIYTFGSASNIWSPVSTSGQYATWVNATGDINNPYALYFRNLLTHTDTLIYTIGDVDKIGENNVASNGVVVFVNNNSDISKYQNGVTVPIINDDYLSYPVTDGKNIVYTATNTNSDNSVYLYDGTSQTALGDDGSSNPFYTMNDKYIAYTAQDGSGNQQAWIRDSAGNKSQVSFFGSDSYVQGLATNGDVMFMNNATRYLARKGILQPLNLGRETGLVVYRDSSWYIIEGRYLYKLLVDAFVTINDGNWNNPSTWQNNVVPPSNADVIVENNVTLSSNETCNTLKVVSPGSVIVLTGFNLTVLH